MRPEAFLQVLDKARDLGVSDLILAPGQPPLYKLGERLFVADYRVLELRDLQDLVASFFPEGAVERFLSMAREREVPQEMMAAYTGVHSRYRVQLLWGAPDPGDPLSEAWGDGVLARPVLILRLIDLEPRSMEALGLPVVLEEVVRRRMGLFLVAGPTDSGKTTTLASMVERINQEQARFVVTLEYPIEYVFTSKKAFIVQRELGRHVPSLAQGVLTALRSNVSALVLGEVRGSEEVEAMLLAAETGHLVLASLHAVSATDAIERVALALPPGKREPAFQVLSSVLLGVLVQRLVPLKGENRRALAYELLLATPDVKALLKEGRLDEVEALLEGGGPGLVSLERSLAELVLSGRVAFETARAYANRDGRFTALLRRG